MATLTLRDRYTILHVVPVAIANQCDDVLYEEVAGALENLTDLPVVERILHAFEAQRLTITQAEAEEIAEDITCLGLTITPVHAFSNGHNRAA